MEVVWNIFHFLRIIPESESIYINKVAFIMWLILIIACTLAILVGDLYCSGQICSYATSKMATFLLCDLLVPLQSMLVFRAVASVAEESKIELKTIKTNPKYSIFCLLTTIFQFTSCIVSVILPYENGNTWYNVAWVIQIAVNFLITSASRIIIGVLINRLCKNIADSFAILSLENINITIAPIITDYKLLQDVLSFLLFSIVALDVVMVTSNAYFLIKVVESYFMIPFILYLTFELFYIAFVMDDCYSDLKSTLPLLRYFFRM